MRGPDDIYGDKERTITGPLFEDGPFSDTQEPTPDELLVGSLIWRHRGRGNPVPIARLKELSGFSERRIKDIVEQLVVTYRIQIGGRREEPSGYFVIESDEDRATAVGPYRSQISAMVRRLRVLESGRDLLQFLRRLTQEVETDVR